MGHNSVNKFWSLFWWGGGDISCYLPCHWHVNQIPKF